MRIKFYLITLAYAMNYTKITGQTTCWAVLIAASRC